MSDTGHTITAADKDAAQKALRDIYDDKSSSHRAELLSIISDTLRDVGIPAHDIERLAEESLRNAAYPTDDLVTQEKRNVR